VQTSALDLTGDYLGQTKTKVTKQLDEVNGGVLFIDEAYELGQGPYGEAMTTLLEAMTSLKYKGLVIIIAGYKQQIHQMLNQNPGLKSRFNNFYSFEDWAPEDCVEYFASKLSEGDYIMDISGRKSLLDGFSILRSCPGWANAHDVQEVWKSVLKQRAIRVAANPEKVRTIMKSDIKISLKEMIKHRKVRISPEKVWNGPSAQIADQTATREVPSLIQETQTIETVAEPEPEPEPQETTDSKRDAGVSDAVWEELEVAKREYHERMSQERTEEEARIEAEKQAKIQEQIRHICPCPVGFSWFKVGDGWRCEGGSHYVSNEQLNSQFTVLEPKL